MTGTSNKLNYVPICKELGRLVAENWWYMKRTTLLERAEYAVAQRLRSLKGNEIFRSERPGYTRSPEENLIPVVTRKDFWEDLQGGDGSELSDSAKAPAKFCAAYSSSALVSTPSDPFGTLQVI